MNLADDVGTTVRMFEEMKSLVKALQAAHEKLDRVRALHARLEGVAPLWALELKKVLGDE